MPKKQKPDPELTFDGYLQSTEDTAIYKGNISKMVDYIASGKATPVEVEHFKDMLNLIYTSMGLAGEAGEVLNKLKKVIRQGKFIIPDPVNQAIAEEMGDVGWYKAQTVSNLGWPYSKIMGNNLAKLASRQERGTLEGNGDHR